MLALTDNAVEAVKEIVSSSDETAEAGGLRLVAQESGLQTGLQLSVTALPAEDDEVIEEQGACAVTNATSSRNAGAKAPSPVGSRG